MYFLGLFFNQIEPENGKISTLSPGPAPIEFSGKCIKQFAMLIEVSMPGPSLLIL